MILLIDNYDSFVHNLARYFRRLGHETLVVRNDAIDVAGIRRLDPAALILSPGPASPAEAGICVDAIRQLHAELPLLGVCLGHQALAVAFGGALARCSAPMHGQASPIVHDGGGVFAGLPNPLIGCRYHSLEVVECELPAELEVTARAPGGTVMAIAHRRLPVIGLQFHPESILSEHGYRILAAFLSTAGLSSTLPADEAAGSLVAGASRSGVPKVDPLTARIANRPPVR